MTAYIKPWKNLSSSRGLSSTTQRRKAEYRPRECSFRNTCVREKEIE